jgi:hypothetical protein
MFLRTSLWTVSCLVLSIEEVVMAKVIVFYMPRNFRKPLTRAAQSQLSNVEVIEFYPSKTPGKSLNDALASMRAGPPATASFRH